MRQLTHVRLDVYQKPIEYLAIAVQLITTIPKGYATVADQLKRASFSVKEIHGQVPGPRSQVPRPTSHVSDHDHDQDDGNVD